MRPPADNYDILDFQLLFELRLALMEGNIMPVSTLRILRARGWISMPDCEEWLVCEFDPDDESLDTLSTGVQFAVIQLTNVGQRELDRFKPYISECEMYSILVEDEEDTAEREDDS